MTRRFGANPLLGVRNAENWEKVLGWPDAYLIRR